MKLWLRANLGATKNLNGELGQPVWFYWGGLDWITWIMQLLAPSVWFSVQKNEFMFVLPLVVSGWVWALMWGPCACECVLKGFHRAVCVQVCLLWLFMQTCSKAYGNQVHDQLSRRNIVKSVKRHAVHWSDYKKQENRSVIKAGRSFGKQQNGWGMIYETSFLIHDGVICVMPSCTTQ